MVKYEILKPPTNNSYLNELNKKELKKYYDWYIALIPERLNLLAQIVKSTPGYSEWKMDFTPESLVKLGFWFYENIETRALSEKEIEDKINSAPNIYDKNSVEKWEVTEKSFSIAIDIGMYLASVLLRNNSALYWEHCIKVTKNNAKYGHPVLANINFCPTRVCYTLAYTFADKSKDGNELKEAYDVWDEIAKNKNK